MHGSGLCAQVFLFVSLLLQMLGKPGWRLLGMRTSCLSPALAVACMPEITAVPTPVPAYDCRSGADI